MSTWTRRAPRPPPSPSPPSLPGEARHRSPRHSEPARSASQGPRCPHPAEPVVTHRASRVCGRRLSRPSRRSRRSGRTCRASPRRCELPAASARLALSGSAERAWQTPRVGAAAPPGLADVVASGGCGRTLQRPDARPRRRLRFPRRAPSRPGPGPDTGGLPVSP